MTVTAVPSAPAAADVAPRPGSRGLLRAEWTKIRSVRSTAWSLAVLVVTTVGLTTLAAALTMRNWNTMGAAVKQIYRGDPTGFVAPAVSFAQIPLCVLGVLVITGEYATGMIRSSALAVPRRTPMFAAKAVVFGALSLAAGEVLAFASFPIAQAIIGNHLRESLGDPATFRAVAGVGLYLAALGLLAYAIGALVRHTGAAITGVAGFTVVLPGLARLLPGSIGEHVAAYLPAGAGLLITHAHQEAADLLSPWQGFGVCCLWTALLLAAAACVLGRRDV